MVLKDYLMRSIFPSTLFRASARKRVELRRNLYLICIAYLLLVTCAEVLTIYNPKAGIALHAVILFTLLLHSGMESDKDKNLSTLLMALVLAPLIRILSLSMPFIHFSKISGSPLISGFMLISIPIFVAIFTCMWVQGLRAKEVGLYLSKLKHTPIEAGVILLAIPVGITEYQILEPAILQGSGSGAVNFITASLILIVCTGFLEELAFRGLIQHNAIKLMSKWRGILFVSTLFGVLHVGNLALWDCVIAFSVGLIFSIVREKTGSIYGISISHGIINIILFLIAPTIAITFFP